MKNSIFVAAIAACALSASIVSAQQMMQHDQAMESMPAK